MEQEFRDKIMPTQWFWCILNNLDKFNDKPDLILDLIGKFKKIEDHRILSTLKVIIEAVEKGYNELGKFPDVAWLKLNFKGNIAIIISNDEFSMQIYESMDRYLDQELIKQEINRRIVEKDNPTLEDYRRLIKDITTFSDRIEESPEQTKERLINLYDEYSESFDGIQTHIKPVDDVIGILGYQSLSVFAAPSGHGKSTFAMSVAYYAALDGKQVDYLSFEIPENHAWFNFVSMYSEDKDIKLKSSIIKEAGLNEEEQQAYKKYTEELLDLIKAKGGYLKIIDQTSAGASTFEGLCAKLESMAEERKRPADLIVVDNVDNLQILKSSERDEATRVNNYIIALDSFCKKYYNGRGTAILLLSQVNRTALKRLHSTEGEDAEKKTKIDVTCVQKFNALYEKATCVLIGYADEVLRSQGTMKIHPAKLRNRAVPTKPITVSVNFGFSKIRGEFALNKVCGDGEEGRKKAEKVIDGWIKENSIGLSAEEAAEIDAELIEDLDL